MNDKVYGEDREYGNDGERRVEDRLARLFGPLQSLSADDKYSEFDFKNDHVYVEVKRRRNTKLKYPTTMVGENKVVKGFELQMAGFRVFFVFDFVDVMCLWELKRDEYEVRHGGRTDRGQPEIKSYCYVHTNYLMDVKEDANEITADRPEARIHHEEAVRQAARQDAGRYHQAQPEEGEETEAQGEEEALGDDDTHLLHRDDDDPILIENTDSE